MFVSLPKRHSRQFRDDSFWYKSYLVNDSDHDASINPNTDARMLSINGSNDTTVPYNGGIGILKLDFLSAQETAFLWAKLMGYEGNQLGDESSIEGPDDFFKYSYLDDKVVHYKIQGGGHGYGIHKSKSHEVIYEFLTSE